MVESRSDLVVYAIHVANETIYVGQGTIFRAQGHLFPSRYKKLGLTEKPELKILMSNLTRDQALSYEAAAIKLLKPKMNKAKFSSHGGIPTWNAGTKGDPRNKGGRPVGIPMSDETKAKLSEALKGQATKWMTGKTPWNKGLTKADPRVAKGVETYAPKRQEVGIKIWKKRRKSP